MCVQTVSPQNPLAEMSSRAPSVVMYMLSGIAPLAEAQGPTGGLCCNIVAHHCHRHCTEATNFVVTYRRQSTCGEAQCVVGIEGLATGTL